jgi:hypothetical protein
MKGKRSIAFMKMDVELTEEIIFWIWTWKMESNGCLFLLNSSNQLQPWDRCVTGRIKPMMTRVNKSDEGMKPSTHIVKLVSAFHSGCSRLDGIGCFCDSGIPSRLESEGRVIGYADAEERLCLLDGLA